MKMKSSRISARSFDHTTVLDDLFRHPLCVSVTSANLPFVLSANFGSETNRSKGIGCSLVRYANAVAYCVSAP